MDSERGEVRAVSGVRTRGESAAPAGESGGAAWGIPPPDLAFGRGEPTGTNALAPPPLSPLRSVPAEMRRSPELPRGPRGWGRENRSSVQPQRPLKSLPTSLPLRGSCSVAREGPCEKGGQSARRRASEGTRPLRALGETPGHPGNFGVPSPQAS